MVSYTKPQQKMKIQPNSSTSEKDSSYFERNKAFCEAFENFIQSKNGKVKGDFNVWSYAIIGKIDTPQTWTLKYKKATFTSGNIFLSSKHQNLLTSAEWKTKSNFGFDFRIRRKSARDVFNFALKKLPQILAFSDAYFVESNTQNLEAISELTNILKPLFISDEVYEIENTDSELKIELRTEKHHFDVFEQLLEMK